MFKLTDKALKDFERWRFLKSHTYIYELPDIFYHSLVIEFFDSVGIYIEIQIHQRFAQINMWRGKINNNLYDDLEYKPSRLDATSLTIEKANEIYNSR